MILHANVFARYEEGVQSPAYLTEVGLSAALELDLQCNDSSVTLARLELVQHKVAPEAWARVHAPSHTELVASLPLASF